ncbi:MAG: insulinase family protein [Flavobacteriales bacterium]|nr:insulinase family protein [Flavobacteriales bacterium]
MKRFQPSIHTLPNGVRVVYLHVPNQVAHLGYFFAAGSRFEAENQVGLAHFLEHCVFKGTQKRKAIHILSRIDSVGGELNAYTAKEEMCLHASFSKEHTAKAIDLLSDISIHSIFPPKEIEKEKEVILDELNSYMDNPGEKIFDDFEAELFKNHSLGNNILGTKESVESFSRADLESFVSTYFTADNLVISFVGNVSYSRLEKLLLNSLEGIPLTAQRNEVVPFLDYKPFHIRTKEANYQTHGVIGGMAPSYKSDNRIPMSLLINLLGGPALNSRLNLTVREKYGYAYTVEASYNTYADTGFWQIYLGSESKNIDKAIELIYKEVKLLETKELSSIQLHRAKEQLKGHLALGMDSNSGLMQGLGKSMLAFNQIDTLQEMHQGIDKITSKQLLEMAATFMKRDASSELIFDC